MSCLVFKYFSHSEFIFVHDVKVYSNFIDLHVAVPLAQYHLLRRLSSPLHFLVFLAED